MCGRFTLSSPADVVAQWFQLVELPDLAPRYNIAPSQPVAVIGRKPDSADKSLRTMRWGLVPRWAKDPAIGNRMINARGETAHEKPSFRDAFRKRRCLIPADGFYEWKKGDGGKQPYYISVADAPLFAFAGLWEAWRAEDGHTLYTCTILTTSPNKTLADIHDRMPVIVPQDAYDRWLDPSLDQPQTSDLLRPYTASDMTARPVSTHVNRPANDDPECVQPID